MDSNINLIAAWIGFALGGVSGAIPGLFFHRKDWLGGYGSWPRRLTRLAHVSFFGIGLLNMCYAGTCLIAGIETSAAAPLLLVAAVLMPAVCYLSAFKRAFRHFFFFPAGSLILAVCIVIERLVSS